jgi:hypothetical protein
VGEPRVYNLGVTYSLFEYYPGDGEINEKTGIKGPSFFDLKNW